MARQLHLGRTLCPDSNINIWDSKGRTPLYFASLLNHVGVLEVLLRNIYIDPNRIIIWNEGTAFSVASEKSHFQIMGLLVDWNLLDDVETLVDLGWCVDSWTTDLSKCRKTEQSTPATQLAEENTTGD